MKERGKERRRKSERGESCKTEAMRDGERVRGRERCKTEARRDGERVRGGERCKTEKE